MATGEIAYADLILSTLDVYLSATDARLGLIDKHRNCLVEAWGSWVENYPVAEISNSGCILYPLALLCHFSKGDINLHQRCLGYLKSCIPAVEAFIRECIIVDQFTLYRSPIDGRVEPWNHVHQFAAVLLSFGTHMQRNDFLSLGNDLLDTFMAFIELEANGGYSWSYRPYLQPTDNFEVEKKDESYQKRPEQIWKGIQQSSFL